jgi:acyl-CoA thioesterase-1
VIIRALQSSCLLALVLLAGCKQGLSQGGASTSTTTAVDAAPQPSATTVNSNAPRIVFLGDSLTAGFGLDPDKSYPALLQRRLTDAGYKFAVVNAGVSGDTSAGGLRRVDWSLEGNVKILVVALGANDGLRGLPPDELRKNLAAIIERAQKKKVVVILAGMEAPTNNGADYTSQFRLVYKELAKQYNVPLIPFLLQGVAGLSALNQDDGIHPNAKGAQIVADVVWATLEPVIQHDFAPRRQ